jgi:hypothetical protein
MGEWLKTVMMQVIAMTEKGTGLVEAVSNVEFCVHDLYLW